LQTAVVTGASTGIGRAIAERLARDGFNVVLNSKHDVDGGQRAVQAISDAGGSAEYLQADVSTEVGARSLIEFAHERFSDVTTLVNNAGATRTAPYGEWTAEHWRDMLDTNLLSTALMCQALTNSLASEADAAIVNIASIRGLPSFSRVGAAAYSSAKAGVLSLTGALARALAPRVRVNAVSPGFVETAYMTRADESLKSQWHEAMPIGRFISPEEIASAVVFLLSQPAVTGANLVVDGGWSQTAI
jgi:3-oxoacyl-[acyl-carrier protein] reductase